MAEPLTFNLPHNPAVPVDARKRIEKRRRESPHTPKAVVDRLVPKLIRAHEAGLEHVRKQFGGVDVLQRLSTFRPTVARGASATIPRKARSVAAADLDRRRTDRLQESKAFLDKLALPPDRVKGVIADLHANLRDVVADLTMEYGDLFDDIELPPIADIRRPPYPGFSKDEGVINAGGLFSLFDPKSWFTRGLNFDVETVMTIEPSSASVQSTIKAYDPRAGESDYLYALAQTFVGFWYQMPKAGRIQVVVEGVPSASSHHLLALTNELWWSTSYASQLNGVAFRCTSADAETFTATLATEFSKDGEKDGNWYVNPYSAVTRWIQMTSATGFAAGEFVFVEVGNDTIQDLWANDVSMVSIADFNWRFASIRVAVVD